jgi:hypothetical protein
VYVILDVALMLLLLLSAAAALVLLSGVEGARPES